MEIIEQNRYYKVALDTIKTIDFYREQLPVDLINKAHTSFKNEQRIREWLHTHYMIKKLTDIFQTYGYNEWRKPFCSVTGEVLSIAHSDMYSAVIIASSGLVGIDIEEKGRDFKRASVKFINNKESVWVKSNEDLIKIWCFKEAAFKIINNASPDFKNDYHCIMSAEKTKVFVNKPIEKSINMFFIDNEKYFLTWCFEK